MTIARIFSAFRRPLLAGLALAAVGWASAASAGQGGGDHALSRPARHPVLRRRLQGRGRKEQLGRQRHRHRGRRRRGGQPHRGRRQPEGRRDRHQCRPGAGRAGLQAAKDASIPVFGMDSGADPLLVTNVTSNGYAMAAETGVYVANRINGDGNVVMFVFDAFPPVQVRGVIADAVFKNFPDIKILDRVTPDVTDGGIADFARQDGGDPRRQPGQGQHRGGVGRLGPARARRAAGDRGGRPHRRRHRHRRHRRQPAGPRGDRRRRQFRGLGGAGFRRHRQRHGRRHRPRPLEGEAIKQKVIYVPTRLVTAANVATLDK